MIFLSSVAATLVFFDHSGDIIHINISTSVGVEPTNAACAPSTATSDVLNHYTIEASPKKDAQLAYITTPHRSRNIMVWFGLPIKPMHSTNCNGRGKISNVPRQYHSTH